MVLTFLEYKLHDLFLNMQCKHSIIQYNNKRQNLILAQIEYRLFHDELLNKNVLHTSSRNTLYRVVFLQYSQALFQKVQ